MSIFNELLPKLFEISSNSAKNFNLELQTALDCLDKFEEEYHNGRGNAREKAQRDKTNMTMLQSINEDDDESNKIPETKITDKTTDNGKIRISKKRSKEEVEGMSSPEQDKRAKRNASVKAQSIISKQEKEREILEVLNTEGVAFVSSEVNVNLTQKLRRDDSIDKKSRRRKEDDKENAEPIIPPIKIKQEKISLLPEPMDTESISLNVGVKQEPTDEMVMPPPVAPVPKSRKGHQKEKEKQKDSDETSEEENSGKRRTTRTRKQTDIVPPQPASTRSTRASTRASRATKQPEAEDLPPPEPRPKRTRGKKKVSDASTTDSKNSTQTVDESAPTSPAEKPRPKRTRRGKNAEKEEQKAEDSQNDQEKFAKDQEKFAKDQQKFAKDQEKFVKDQEQFVKDQEQFTKDQERITKDQERITKDQEKTTKDQKETPYVALKEEAVSLSNSPVVQMKNKKQIAEEKKAKRGQRNNVQNETSSQDKTDGSSKNHVTLDETAVVHSMNVTVTLNKEMDMDRTVVLPNGVYNHAPVTPKNIHANETVVLESRARETILLDKPNINDATVVLDKDVKQTNITDDNSLLTDDGSETETLHTPPKPVVATQPTSAVKEKVQQFEELAARTTRTKTRAMAKVEELGADNHTPPDKMMKPVLSQETLTKMNSMIFNGKPPQQISSSASKPHAVAPSKLQTASTSKLSALHKHKEAADREREKEDARKKKEAMLEAKREQQKKKREEKMANAAAAREAAERERKLAIEALAKERMEKQLHADQGKQERLKEVERKKQELARKVAETEERRRAEEAARMQRLAEEQRKADELRARQLQEAQAIKKEAALVAKEIEKKQKEYLVKQKQKQKLENEKSYTPFKTPGTPKYSPLEPVYMQDGFQYLNSDEDDDNTQRPGPAWSSSKTRKLALSIQSQITQVHIDKLFSVRVHSPDLREIFPRIERSRLKRTSSAVWRTPPRLPTLAE